MRNCHVHDYRDFECYKVARKWYDDFDVDVAVEETANYSVIHEFAKDKLKEASESRSFVDAKADGLVKFAATAVAVNFAAAASPQITGMSRFLVLASLFFVSLSTVFALLSRRRVVWPSPMEICDAIAIGKKAEPRQRALLAASLHMATTGIAAHVTQKARMLDKSIACIAIAAGLLAASAFFIANNHHRLHAETHSARERTP